MSTAGRTRYGSVAIGLHWIIAAGIALQVAMGLAMVQFALPMARKFQLYQLHKSVGVVLLLAVLLRIGWRLTHRPPPLPAEMPRRERAAASGVHLLLYALMLALPLSGWALVSASVFNIPTVLFGLVPWPHLPVLSTLADKAPVEGALKWVHAWLAWSMLALLALHVGAVARHALAADSILGRMLPLPPRRSLARTGAVTLFLVGVPGMARAADWVADARDSTLSFSGVQTGTPFTGTFKVFTARIVFDPAQPQAGRADVVIDLASAATGDGQRDAALPQPEWFNVPATPTATFHATSFVAKGGDSYAAPGTLTVRGIAVDVTLLFTLRIDGDTARAKGHLDMDRTAVGVGQGPWASAEYVALAVGVDVDLTAHRAR